MTRHYIFVYGTLKANEPNHHVILDKGYVDADTKFIGNATTQAPFPMVIASKYNIPFVLDRQGTGHVGDLTGAHRPFCNPSEILHGYPTSGKRIHGEVYSVTEGTLSRLDELECHPDYYERRSVQVEVAAADPDTSSSSDEDAHPRTLTCNMYLFHNFDPALLELPFITNYTSTGSHGLEYVDPGKRVPGEVYPTKWEVKHKLK